MLRKQNEEFRRSQRREKTFRTVALWVGILTLLSILYAIFFPYLQRRDFVPYYLYLFGAILPVFTLLFFLNSIRRKNGRKPFEESDVSLFINLLVILSSSLIGFFVYFTTYALTGDLFFSGLIIAGILPVLLFIYSRFRKTNVTLCWDFAGIFLLFVYSTAKLGCHTAGCCGGIAIEQLIFRRNQIPVQLIEFVLCALLCAFAVWYLMKAKRPIGGILFPFSLLSYGVVRYVMEILIVRPPHIRIMLFFGDRVSFWQLLSLIYIVWGGIWLAAMLIKQKVGEK